MDSTHASRRSLLVLVSFVVLAVVGLLPQSFLKQRFRLDKEAADGSFLGRTKDDLAVDEEFLLVTASSRTNSSAGSSSPVLQKTTTDNDENDDATISKSLEDSFILQKAQCLETMMRDHHSSLSSFSYVLVASSERFVDQTVCINYNQTISFVLYRQDLLFSSSSSSSSSSLSPCSNQTLLNHARNLLVIQQQQQQQNQQKHNKEMPPLSQTAFFRVYIDVRVSSTRQTRRVSLNVYEIESGFFFFQIKNLVASGITVLTFEVAFESDNYNKRIDLDLYGGDCFNCVMDPVHGKEWERNVSQHVKLRYEPVLRVAMHVEIIPNDEQQQQQQPSSHHRSDTTIARPCDYASGDGEWVFAVVPSSRTAAAGLTWPLPESLVSDVANAPFVEKSNTTMTTATAAFYRLFSCSDERYQKDFELAQTRFLLENKKRSMCMLGDSNPEKMQAPFQQVFPEFQYRSYYFQGTEGYFLQGKQYDVQIPMQCHENHLDDGNNENSSNTKDDILFLYQGSHCQFLNIPTAKEKYRLLFPDMRKLARCVVGVDTVQPYERVCPQRFRLGEKFVRNPWRVRAKNLLQREAYERNGMVFASLDAMSLAIQDVAMKGHQDCVHYHRNKESLFDFYPEAVKLLIAAAGQGCRLDD